MDKALSPYVKGGGAKRYEEELKRLYAFDEVGAVGGFQVLLPYCPFQKCALLIKSQRARLV